MRVVTGLIVLGSPFLLPGLALSQGANAVDPSADSPSGAIYEIPVERARDDAAPRSTGSGRADRSDDGGAGAGGSDGGGGGGAPGTSQGVAPAGGDAGDEPTSIKSENGFGSSAIVPGYGGVRGDGGNPAAGSQLVAVDGGEDAAPEGSPYLLLAILVVAGGIGGFAVARRARLT